jgi:hypothetical protein
MLAPLVQNNLTYPQPSVTLANNRVQFNATGADVGLISIRGLGNIILTTMSGLNFVIEIESESVGFIDGLLKLAEGEMITSPERFDLTVSGIVLLDNSEYSIIFEIIPITKYIPSRVAITISLQLEVIANNKILVPGCEPTSALSSTTLSSYLADAGCGNALVDLNDALEAIPGSWVKLGSNFCRGGYRQKWFVLPPTDTDCPCDQYTDWYRILRELANEELPVEEEYDACDIIGMGYCPSPDFEDIAAPPKSPYKEEGSFPAGVGILPPVPPWGLSKT